jgi:hypothetical protein
VASPAGPACPEEETFCRPQPEGLRALSPCAAFPALSLGKTSLSNSASWTRKITGHVRNNDDDDDDNNTNIDTTLID